MVDVEVSSWCARKRSFEGQLWMTCDRQVMAGIGPERTVVDVRFMEGSYQRFGVFGRP